MMKRKQSHPTKALRQLGSLQEKLENHYIIIDPFTIEQLSTNPSLNYGLLNKPYQIRMVNGKHCSVYLPNYTSGLHSHHQQHFSSNTSSTSGEEEMMLSPSEQEKSPARNKNIVVYSPGVEGPMIDDSMAIPLRTKEESNKIFSEILAHKRTMQLTGRPGAPINMSLQPFALTLTLNEFVLCCFLRLTPIQYYASRDTLVRNWRKSGFYKKSAAQKMLRIDVNKTGRIYDFCIENGWLPRDEFDGMVKELPASPSGIEQYF